MLQLKILSSWVPYDLNLPENIHPCIRFIFSLSVSSASFPSGGKLGRLKKVCAIFIKSLTFVWALFSAHFSLSLQFLPKTLTKSRLKMIFMLIVRFFGIMSTACIQIKNQEVKDLLQGAKYELQLCSQVWPFIVTQIILLD